MNILTLNDHQLYYLRCLCQAVYEETGVWLHLQDNDQADILKLLRYSSTAPFELIYGYFCSFVLLLDTQERLALIAENVFLPQELLDSHNLVEEVDKPTAYSPIRLLRSLQ